MNFNFLKPAKYFFILSATLTLISAILVFYPGPRLSIEFTGGTRMELKSPKPLETEAVLASLNTFKLSEANEELNPTVNKSSQGTFIVRTKNLTDADHKALTTHLQKDLGAIEEVQYTTIGPTVGASLKSRAAYALLVASAGIVLYLAFAFRHIPRKYKAWKFGVAAVITLLHDVMVTVGIFVILSYYTNFEVDTLFITALLTILGYSVNDTIIIFDRIRDNIAVQERKETFAQVANTSVNQTWKRSLYTSSSTLIMLFALFALGSVSIKWFVLTLIIGILLGTYSSIFVATPLLVYWVEGKKKQ